MDAGSKAVPVLSWARVEVSSRDSAELRLSVQVPSADGSSGSFWALLSTKTMGGVASPVRCRTVAFCVSGDVTDISICWREPGRRGHGQPELYERAKTRGKELYSPSITNVGDIIGTAVGDGDGLTVCVCGDPVCEAFTSSWRPSCTISIYGVSQFPIR